MPRLFTALLLLFAGAGYAQQMPDVPNALHYDYSSLYNAHSTSLTKHYAALNFSQELTKGKLLYSAAIAAYNLNYDVLTTGLNTNGLEHITSLKLGITYLHPLGNNWNGMLQFSPELTSNFKNTTANDIYPGFFAGASRTITGDKASSLVVGVGYKGYFGKFRFMPVVTYHKKVNEKLAYTVGIPAMDVAYSITPQHVLKGVLFADAFYSKIRNENYIYNARQDTDAGIRGLEMVTVNAGLEYNYVSQDQWMATVKAGYSIYNNLTLKDSDNATHTINFTNNIYISLGFKYNLNF